MMLEFEADKNLKNDRINPPLAAHGPFFGGAGGGGGRLETSCAS